MKVSIELYKKIEYINGLSTIDSVDKMAYIVSEVYGLEPDKVNVMNPSRFIKLTKRVNYAINKPKPFYGFYLPILTDAKRLTFGQFVDLQHWFKDEAANLDIIIARLLIGTRLQDIDTNRAKVAKVNINRVIIKYKKFRDSYEKLMFDNKELFETRLEIEDDDGKVIEDKSHPFIEAFGWFYVGESFTEYFKITLDAVFELPIMEALSALNYLKAKQNYEKQMLRN